MAAVGRVDNVVVLSGDLFDAIEVNAARTGNHKRAAVRMSRLAVQATAGGMSRAEAHMRAGEQWLLADGGSGSPPTISGRNQDADPCSWPNRTPR